MLGNDIVDLQKAALESNWQRKGYLEKIFTPNEQLAIHNSSNPNTMVWLFWSMKEAVYKIINRQMLVRFYCPKKFECKILLLDDGKAEGSVKYNGNLYFTQSELNQNYIYSKASTEISNLKKINTQHLPNTRNYLDVLKHKSSLTIQKNLFGVPEIIDFKFKKIMPVTISHHGRYLVIAY